VSSEERWRCFLFDAQDFLTSDLVDLMTPEERGGYIMLLCRAWLSRPPGYLKDDDESLAVWSRLYDRWPACSARIREGFEVCERMLNGRSVLFLKQPRLVREYDALLRRKEHAKKAGQASGRARKSRKHNKNEHQLNTCSTDVELNANSLLNTCSTDVELNANSLFTLVNTSVHSSKVNTSVHSSKVNTSVHSSKVVNTSVHSSKVVNTSVHSSKGGAGGKTNPIWDAICQVCELKPATKGDRARIGKVVADLKAKSATPDEIFIRAARYREQWPTVAFTPEALVKHWDTFAKATRPAVGSPVRIQAPAGKYSKGDIEC